MTLACTKSAPSLLPGPTGLEMAHAVRGFFSSKSRPYGLVDPVAAVSQLSSAVISVPHGV